MSNLTNESQNKKQRLGRGLGSLLGGSADIQTETEPRSSASIAAPKMQESTPSEARIWNIPIEKLVPSPYQPRSHFDSTKIQELADSIKERGIVQPLVARKLNNGTYEIIAGERRWRAAQAAGLFEVPVQLKILSNKEALEIAIIENVQREDLSAIEEAEAYQRLMQEFQLTQQQVAERVGKDRVTVTNSLRLLQLPTQIRDLVGQGELSQGHAKVLLSVTDLRTMQRLAEKVRKEGLSVRSLEREIKKISADSGAPQETPKASTAKIQAEGLRQQMQNKLGTKVSIDYSEGQGKISIHFYSDEELSSIYERICP